MPPVDLCQAYLEPGGGFLGHRCGRLATHEVVLEDGRQGRLCDLCWDKVQDQARKHTVRLMQHERFTEPSIVYAPYVPADDGSVSKDPCPALSQAEVGALREALASVRATMACDARDWARDGRDAWVFGILLGWEDALGAVVAQHGWKDEDVARLRAMRAAIARVGGSR